MVYHPDVNGGDAKKTELFKQMTIAYQALCEYREKIDAESGGYHRSSSTTTPFARGPGEVRYHRERRSPPSPAQYNMKAWEEMHFGSRNPINVNDYSTRKHSAVHNSFFHGMQDNKGFQYSQRVERRARERAEREQREQQERDTDEET